MRIPRHLVTVAVGVLAVGFATVGAPMAALAASGWAIQPTPNPPGVTQANLNGVSCISSTACTAVGFSVGSSGPILTLAEVWDGASWTTQATPNPTGTLGAILNGVSCSSATACTAVGYYSDKFGNNKTLAEAWDGATWVIQKTPNPSATTNAELSGVSCSSATACIAVGHYFGSSSIATLAQVWNGTKWVTQHTPNPVGPTVNELLGVSCASSTACTAVGFSLNSSNHDDMLAEAWNGTKWGIQHTKAPLGATSAVLRGVSCTSSTSCTAVGDYLGSSVFLTLAEAWNGTKWVIQPTLNPPAAQQSYLNSVSCNSATLCDAVGYANIGSSAQALAEAHS